VICGVVGAAGAGGVVGGEVGGDVGGDVGGVVGGGVVGGDVGGAVGGDVGGETTAGGVTSSLPPPQADKAQDTSATMITRIADIETPARASGGALCRQYRTHGRGGSHAARRSRS
jgi:hypothetical protein